MLRGSAEAMLMRSQSARNVKASILCRIAWLVMLCKRVGRFTYVGVQLRAMISGLLERRCYQMHGSARVEAKGATLCGPGGRQERRRLVVRLDERARARSKFDGEQVAST